MVNLSLEFKYYKIDDIGEVVSGGTPSTSKNEYWYGDIGWITPKDLSTYEGIYISRGERNISFEGLNNSSARLVPKNTVLMTSRAPIGYIAIANNELSTNQGFKSLICDEEICYYKYFYYWLKLNIKYIINNANGSTFNEISGGTFKNLEISLPSITEQKAISSVLWTLDEKISVLKRINKNLNHQRKLLFKNWFIDFNDFSDYELYDTAFGLIPKTWHIYDFKEILTKRTEKSNDDSIPMFSVTNTGIHPREDKFNKKLSASTSKFKLIYKNDLVFGMSREILNWGLMEEQIGGVSSAYNVFRINEEKINPFYLKSFIENYMPYFKDIIKPASREGQGIDQNVLLIKQIYVPPENIFNEFYNIDINFNKLINLNKIKIDKLTNLRDVLLPKLMSGEIDVSNINCE